MSQDFSLSLPDLTDKTIIVTGANSGIGYHTACELGKAHATVILACRNLDKGNDALKRMQENIKGDNLHLMPLDLSDLNSVKDFVKDFTGKFSKLDVLINNAGIMAIPKRTLNNRGWEMQFATNHLGHYALTGLLLSHLLKTDSSRIVTVSSLAHGRGQINLKDLQSEKHYSPWQAYAQTKLANLLFAFELDRLLKENKHSQISLACHPGVSKTNIISTGVQVDGQMTLTGQLMTTMTGLFAQSDYDGALPTIYAATDKSVTGGSYYGPDGLGEVRGLPKLVKAKSKAYDVKLAKNLWLLSQELTGVSFEFS